MSSAASDDVGRRWVYLPVEVQVRELHSRLFLACVAAEAGYGAIVGQKAELASMDDRLPRGIYIEKSCERHGLAYLRYRRAIGHVECCLDEEGVVYASADDYSTRLSDATLGQLRYFFAWGDNQSEVVERYHPRYHDRVAVTGNPRVDLWRPELREIYASERSALRSRYGSFVLVASAFAMVNNTRGPDFVHEIAHAIGRLDGAARTAWWDGYLAHSTALFNALSEAVVGLARAIPDRSLVIRPHPSELIDHWERLAGLAPNLIVVREGSIAPWLLAADAVVHSNCTTGLEAFLSGRPTIAYAPYQDERYDMNLPNAVSQIAATEEELVDLVRENLETDGLPITAEASARAQAHIAALDGPFAAERIVSVLSTIAVPEQRLADSPFRRARSLARTARLRLVSRAERTGRTKSSDRSVAQRPSGKFPGATLEEVRELIARFNVVTGRFGNLDCEELQPNVYAIVAPSQ